MLQVRCNFEVTPAQDMIEHEYENMTEVISARMHPQGLTFPVNYLSASMEQIVSLINISNSCCQYLRYDCYHSLLGHWIGTTVDKYWRDRNGNWKSYFPGGPIDGIGCACQFDYSCGGGTQLLLIIYC